MMDERELEQQLRAALRPVAAPEGLAERIVRRAEARAASRRKPVVRQIWLRWGAIAALLTIGTFGGVDWYEKRQAEQLEARRAAEQFTMAVNIASRKISRLQDDLVVNVKLSPGEDGR